MSALQGWVRIGTEGSAHTLNNNSVFSSFGTGKAERSRYFG